MRRWEYKIISTNELPDGKGFLGLPKERKLEVIEAHLNQLGDEGWEIVSADFSDNLGSPSFFHALAKRERGAGK